jgi:hypothetical protein
MSGNVKRTTRQYTKDYKNVNPCGRDSKKNYCTIDMIQRKCRW